MPHGAIQQGWSAGVNAAFPVASLGGGHSHAGMYISSAVETVIAGASTPAKALGTTILGAVAQDFDMPANNRLRYIGSQTSHFWVTVALSMTSASNIQVLSLTIAKNGTVDASTTIERKVGTGSDIGAAAVNGMFELAEDEYVELWVANETTGGNITVENMNFQIAEVG